MKSVKDVVNDSVTSLIVQTAGWPTGKQGLQVSSCGRLDPRVPAPWATVFSRRLETPNPPPPSHLPIKNILMNVIMPRLEYAGEVWERNPKFVKQLETVQMTAAKYILGCSSTTNNTVLTAELGLYPLKTTRGREEGEMAIQSKED